MLHTMFHGNRSTCSEKEDIFYSVYCPFQDYFTHGDEPIDRWGETGVPRESHLKHPQAELVKKMFEGILP